MSVNKTDMDYVLDCLFEIGSFCELSFQDKQKVLKTFKNYEEDFNILNTSIQCRKCLNAPLANISIFGMVEHYYQHQIDNFRKLGALPALPTRLEA